jgi:hypothetical protein
MKAETCCLQLPVAFKAILMISAIIFFAWHVKGVFKLYSEKRTNYSMKKESHPNGIKLPAITVCPDPAFKYGNTEMEDFGFDYISNNKHLFVNTSVWDVFTNYTYILNRDFIIEVVTGASTGEFWPKNVTVGSNTFEGYTQNTKTTVNVYEMYTKVSGICYTIASQLLLVADGGYMQIKMIINSELPINQWPKSFNILLMLEEERYGLQDESLPGVSPLIINSELGTSLGMSVNKKTWLQIDTKHDVNCTVYENNDSKSRCISKHYAHQYMNTSTCKWHCIPVTMKNAYEIIDSVIDSNKCKTVDENNQMMECTSYDPGQCLPPCNTVEFTSLSRKSSLRSKQDTIIIGMKYKSLEVTVYEEYLIYNFLNFVGSVGGSLGLFIGFSYFDFGTLAIDGIKKKCF